MASSMGGWSARCRRRSSKQRFDNIWADRMAMVPRDPLRHTELELFTRKVAIVVGVAILLAVLWAAREVLILVFIAAVLAAGISPAVHRVRVLGRHYFHRNLSRGTAALIVYLPFLFLALLLLFIMVPRLV